LNASTKRSPVRRETAAALSSLGVRHVALTAQECVARRIASAPMWLPSSWGQPQARPNWNISTLPLRFTTAPAEKRTLIARRSEVTSPRRPGRDATIASALRATS